MSSDTLDAVGGIQVDLAVDHLLHAVNDPYDVRSTFEDRLSWQGVRGGEHPEWGTYNELAYFDLTYIEWIGIKNFAQAAQSRFGREVLRNLSVQEGVGQFALRTSDIDSLAAKWAKQGLPFWGPVSGHRVRADNSVLRWRLLFPGKAGPDEFALPFVIDWGESDETRRLNLESRGVPIVQRAGDRIVGIHSLVRDVDQLCERWEPYYGRLERTTQESAVTLQGRMAGCTAGGVNLLFLEPATALLMDELTRYGERVVQIDVASESFVAEKGNLSFKQLAIDADLSPVHGLRVKQYVIS